jgi:hypothetical protein
MESCMSDEICVLACQAPGTTVVSRGDKLHLYDDAKFLARELNREWPDIHHWAAPASPVELAAHASQAARLLAHERGRY